MDATSLQVTGNPTVDGVLSILGALIPLLSALTSLINHRVRKATEAGVMPDSKLLAVGSALNFASVNVDKGVQLAKLLALAAAAAKHAEEERKAEKPAQE
jgi:hypothetical protein